MTIQDHLQSSSNQRIELMAWFMLSLNVCCSCSMSSEVNKCTKNMLSRFGLCCSESKVVWPVCQLSLSHRYSVVTSLLAHITARLCHRQSGARKALQFPRSLLASHTHNIHLSIGIRHKRLQASAQAKPEKVLNLSFCRVSTSKIQVKRNISCYR